VSALPSGAPLPHGARITDGVLSAEVMVVLVVVVMVMVVVVVVVVVMRQPRP
jgi:hypothetical protein